MVLFSYPADLIDAIKSAWKDLPSWRRDPIPPLPGDAALEDLLAIVYHTSFLREEGRSLSFRIVVLSRLEFQNSKQDSVSRSRTSKFADIRPLSISELRGLAPVADSARTMICVEEVQGEWYSWAILDTGDNWWRFLRHETSSGRPPPERLTILSAGTGELIVSRGGDVLLSLKSGTIYYPQRNLLGSGPVKDFFESARNALQSEVLERINSHKWSEGPDEDYPKRFYNFCLSRILTGVRELSHGGTVIVVPHGLDVADSRLTDRITIKYPAEYAYAWNLMIDYFENRRSYYDMYSKISRLKSQIDSSSYNRITYLSHRSGEINEDLSDCFKFMASLSAVDGALVITDRLALLGFGGEVTAQSPTLKTIQLAMDAEATKTRPVAIEGYGTRHRSAFRFGSSYENSVVFIVSQDGGIKATMRRGAHVIMWPDVQMTFGV